LPRESGAAQQIAALLPKGMLRRLPKPCCVEPCHKVDDPRVRRNWRGPIRVEPLSTYLEKWKAPTSAVTRHGDTIYVSGFPPFDPETGEVVHAPIERQPNLSWSS
jgi:enamine deaminase RidA (YjgF/YER057c/UK114 family)